MKSAISLALAVIMVLGLVLLQPINVAATTEPTGATEAPAVSVTETEPEATEPEATQPEPTEPEEDQGYTASDECLRILKLEEGFSKKPYWDYSQYTVGFGTKCPDDMLDYYLEHGITEPEAEVLLRNHLAEVELDLNKRIIERYGLELTQNQFDALVLFSYNVGTGWTYYSDQNIHQAIKNGATGDELIYWLGRWCKAGGSFKNYLMRRRLSEANMYINGVYDKTPPSHYCFVHIDANGGESNGSVQAYDSTVEPAIRPVATYDGYTFKGWFTAPEGGTQVTKLDASMNGITLYAQWVDDKGNPPTVDKETVDVTVTVTADGVNLRNGPGTNYTRLGKANTGDKFHITETTTGSGYRWGKYEGGWICLTYTNFDEVIKGNTGETVPPTEPTEPPTEPTEPPTEPTEPPTEPTEPPTEPTEPPTEPTEPPTEPTEPPTEPTEPPTEPTEPSTEPTEPEEPEKVMGTVRVNDSLCVRKGPGTGYAVVDGLKNGDRVEILDQQTVGSMVWGKISKGWISMSYVVLDKQDADEPQKPSDDPQTTVLTGTVKANGGLRIRSGAGVDYSVVSVYSNGSKVEILEQKKVGSVTWGKTEKGWVSMDYIVLDQQSGGNTGGTTTPTTEKGTVKVDTMLRARSGPGTSYAVAAYLPNGEKVEITERRTVGSTVWGKTEKGWVSMDFIVLDNQSGGNMDTTQKVIKTVTASCLRVRNSAGTSGAVVGYLYSGSKVEILETKTVNGTVWGRIANGWISMEYTK